MMTKKFEGEDRIMYLLKQSPVPTVDCISSAGIRQNRLFMNKGLPPVFDIFVNVDVFHQALGELIIANFPIVRDMEGRLILMKFTVHPFIASRGSEVMYPGCSLLTITHPQLPGEFFGL